MQGSERGSSLLEAVEATLGKHRQPKHAEKNSQGGREKEIGKANKEGKF